MNANADINKKLNKIVVYAIYTTIAAILFAALLFTPQFFPLRNKNRDFFVLLWLILSAIAAVSGIGLGIAGFINIVCNRDKTKGIVLAIISVLFSGLILYVLLSPKGCRYPASPIVCMANLKHLGVCMQLYTQEHSGKFPAAANWCDMILPYELPDGQNRKRHFTCPEVKSDKGICTYAMNEKISAMKIADVDPNTVLLFETNAGWNQHGGTELLQLRKHRTGRLLCTILYADGHVGRVFEEEVPTLRWKP